MKRIFISVAVSVLLFAGMSLAQKTAIDKPVLTTTKIFKKTVIEEETGCDIGYKIAWLSNEPEPVNLGSMQAVINSDNTRFYKVCVTVEFWNKLKKEYK